MVVICGGQLRQLSRARTGIMVVRYLNIVSFSGKKTLKLPKPTQRGRGLLRTNLRFLWFQCPMQNALLNLETIWQKRLQCCHTVTAMLQHELGNLDKAQPAI